MPTVFRIQNKQGEGPYQTEQTTAKFNPRRYRNPQRHPAPSEDFSALRRSPDGDTSEWDRAYISIVRPYRFAFPSRLAARERLITNTAPDWKYRHDAAIANATNELNAIRRELNTFREVVINWKPKES